MNFEINKTTKINELQPTTNSIIKKSTSTHQTPKQQQTATSKLTKEAEEKVNELTFRIGEKLRIIATRYSRVSEETALFNGA